MKKQTIFENEFIKVSETGRDYDFVAIIENKTDKPITMTVDEEIAEENCITDHIYIPANDWVGLCNLEYEGNTKQALQQGYYQIAHITTNSRLC